MSGLDAIELEVGAGPWLRAAPWVLTALGFATLLSSDAATALKVVLLGGLGLLCGAFVLKRPRENGIARVKLLADGSALLYTAKGTLTATLSDSGWCSRWCCVVPFVDAQGGRRFRCLLCQSRNHPDSYRRLLVHLRLAGAGKELPGLPA